MTALLWGRDAARRVLAAAAEPAAGDECVCPGAAGDACAAGFDLVVATDVMYIHEAVQPLVDTLQARRAACARHAMPAAAASLPAHMPRACGAYARARAQALCGPHTEVLLAYGRNRPAEALFQKAAAKIFDTHEVPEAELDAVYQCMDVTVLRLRLRAAGCGAPPAAGAAAA